MKRTLAAVVAVVVIGGAATLVAQSRQDQQMAAELRMLQEQQQLQALALAQLAESLKTLGPRFDEVIEATRRRLADLELTIKNIGNDLSAVRAQTQDSGTRLGSLTEEIEALRKSLESLPGLIQQALQPPAPVDPNAPPGAVSQAAPPAALPSAIGLSPAQLLGTAKGDYTSGQYVAAIAGFEAVIRNFPGTQAAAEAQYLIGESHYLQKKWPEALAAYDLVIENHAKSAFVSDAYSTRGMAQESTGQLDAAKASFEFTMKNFPETIGGQLARQGFDRVSRQQAARPR